MAQSITVLVLLTVCIQLTIQQSVDRTLEREASGADVVRAVVNRVQDVFGEDHQLLRRIAYIESRDGTNSNTYRNGYHGGIWQVDETAFQSTLSSYQLTQERNKIQDAFDIDWPRVQWSDLRIPLYSAIAARLLMLNIRASIPCTVSQQATYWNNYYNSAGSTSIFITDINALNTMEGITKLKKCLSCTVVRYGVHDK